MRPSRDGHRPMALCAIGSWKASPALGAGQVKAEAAKRGRVAPALTRPAHKATPHTLQTQLLPRWGRYQSRRAARASPARSCV